MMTTYVLFDKRSGVIFCVQHGPRDANEALSAVKRGALNEVKIDEEDMGVIAVPPNAASPNKLYKVDVLRQTLVETEGKDGVGFEFGSGPTGAVHRDDGRAR
jgi:hypothetical protein